MEKGFLNRVSKAGGAATTLPAFCRVSPIGRSEKPLFDEFAVNLVDVGEGNFSRVMKAVHRFTGELFAIKQIDKSKAQRLKKRHPNIFNEILMEKQVLNRLHHPFIVRLHQTFQDKSNVYFLMEYIEQGELWARCMHKGKHIGCSIETAAYFTLQVALALKYIHSQGVIHRDLKVENVMVRSNGQAALVDFGTAKDLLYNELNGPEFVGTPDYMAPEIINNTAATCASDLWALGCMIYQLLIGHTPFRGPSAYLTFAQTQEGKFWFPVELPADASDLIRQLLRYRAEERLGAGPSGSYSETAFNRLLSHSFFKRCNCYDAIVSAVESPCESSSVMDCFPPPPPVNTEFVQLRKTSFELSCLQPPQGYDEQSLLELGPDSIQSDHTSSDDSNAPHTTLETLQAFISHVQQPMEPNVLFALRKLILQLPCPLRKLLHHHMTLREAHMHAHIQALFSEPFYQWRFNDIDPFTHLMKGCEQQFEGEFRDSFSVILTALSLESCADDGYTLAQMVNSLRPRPKALVAVCSSSDLEADFTPIQRHLARIHDSIRLLTITTSVQYYSAWVHGVRFIVIRRASLDTDDGCQWLKKTLENCRYSAQHTVLVTDAQLWSPTEIHSSIEHMVEGNPPPIPMSQLKVLCELCQGSVRCILTGDANCKGVCPAFSYEKSLFAALIHAIQHIDPSWDVSLPNQSDSSDNESEDGSCARQGNDLTVDVCDRDDIPTLLLPQLSQGAVVQANMTKFNVSHQNIPVTLHASATSTIET